MKKLLAVLISVIMAFSLAVVPAYAADAEAIEKDTITAEDLRADAEDIYDMAASGDYFGAIEGMVALIEEMVTVIHNLVGSIMTVLDKECALCGELHDISFDTEAPDAEDNSVVIYR